MTSNHLEKKKILVTGARFPWGLELIRRLHEQGHDVFALETSEYHVARFSNAIKKYYTTVSPYKSVEKFEEDVLSIVYKEGIDLIIPIWEEALYLAKFRNRLPAECVLFCEDYHVIHQLHHKWYFTKLLQQHNIPCPETRYVQNAKDLKRLNELPPYILKKCYSRFCQNMIRVEDPSNAPDVPIDIDNPWIAQEYVEGDQYCSYSICQQGEVVAHSTYPVRFTMEGSSCIAFESIHHKECYDWVVNLVKILNYTGQIAFDFIQKPDGQLYTIECNPRTTSGVLLFSSEDKIDRAFIGFNQSPILAKEGCSQQIAAGMFMYGWRSAIRQKNFLAYLKMLCTTKDVIFSFRDPLPFLSEPFIMSNYFVRSLKEKLPLPVSFTYDLNWTP